MRWIEHLAEPKELLLAWQAPPSVEDRLRWAVGRLLKVGDGAVFNYLRGEEFSALNHGRSVEDLTAAGFSGYPAFDTNPKRRPFGSHEERALEAFLRRVPPALRPDFSNYLAHYRIRPPTELSPFGLLGVTEARLPSDGFSLVDPLEPSACCVDIVFEVAGVRFYNQSDVEIKAGDPLELEPEPANPVDPYAIMVKAAGCLIGYVNRLQAKTIGAWQRERLTECWVARANGSRSSPVAYAFLQVRPIVQAIAA